MRATFRLFLILITLTVILFSWITDQLGNTGIQVLIAFLAGGSVTAFILLNLADQREARRKRIARESRPPTEIRPGKEMPKRSSVDYSLKEKKSGLTWGGGNIKASEATRGTRRKFLGK
jgi:hypothetical protein